MASVNNVCRLCLVTDNLIWVFDQRLQGSDIKNMNEVVFIATGIQIHYNDIISQSICSNCYQISRVILKFREMSKKSNKILEDRYKAETQSSIPKYNISESICQMNKQKVVTNEEIKTNIGPYNIHPTISNIYKLYPQIKLPSICLKSHVAPSVCVEIDSVEKYFQQENFKNQLFGQIGLKSKGGVSMQSTSCIKSNASYETESLLKRPDIGSVQRYFKQETSKKQSFGQIGLESKGVVSKKSTSCIKSNASYKTESFLKRPDIDSVEKYFMQETLKNQSFDQIGLKSKGAVSKKSTSCIKSNASYNTESFLKRPAIGSVEKYFMQETLKNQSFDQIGLKSKVAVSKKSTSCIKSNANYNTESFLKRPDIGSVEKFFMQETLKNQSFDQIGLKSKVAVSKKSTSCIKSNANYNTESFPKRPDTGSVEKYFMQETLKNQSFGQIGLKSKVAVSKKSTSCIKSNASYKTESCLKEPDIIEQSQIIPSVSSSVEIGLRRNITNQSASTNIETNREKKFNANESQIVPEKPSNEYSKLGNTSDLGISDKCIRENIGQLSSDDYSDMLCLGKSVPLITCNICDSFHNNPGNLKRHMRKHLLCQFCKSVFKSVEIKNQHVESSCMIKNTMKNEPVVNLERLELNIQIRSRYPEAFNNFPFLPTLQFLKSKSREIINKNYTEFDASVICIDDIDNCIQETTDEYSLDKYPA